MPSRSWKSPALHFRGVQVLWLIGGVLLLLGLRFARPHPLPAVARDGIVAQLQADYSLPILHTLSVARQPSAAQDAAVAELEKRQQVQIDHATARGILRPKFVRVEVSLHGMPPPDARPVRYFALDWSGGVTREISELRYYTTLW